MDVVIRLGVRIEMHWPLFSIGTLQLNSSRLLYLIVTSLDLIPVLLIIKIHEIHENHEIHEIHMTKKRNPRNPA